MQKSILTLTWCWSKERRSVVSIFLRIGPGVWAVGWGEEVGVPEVCLLSYIVHIQTSLQQRLHSATPVNKLDAIVQVGHALNTNLLWESVITTNTEVEEASDLGSIGSLSSVFSASIVVITLIEQFQQLVSSGVGGTQATIFVKRPHHQSISLNQVRCLIFVG